MGEYLHVVVLEGEAEALVDKKVNRGPMLVGNLKVALLHKFQHGTFGELIETALAHKPLAPCVLTEKEIEDESHDRHKIDDQHPGHCLCRLPVVHQDVEHCHYLDKLVCND